jgi:hypothetical protein
LRLARRPSTVVEGKGNSKGDEGEGGKGDDGLGKGG